MDTVDGSERDSLSLHKYLYTEDNPIDRTDPGGHFWGESILDPIYNAIAGTIQRGDGELRVAMTGGCGTPGPDITLPLNNTMAEIKTVFLTTLQKPGGKAILQEAADEVLTNISFMAGQGWDITALAELGMDGYGDFGNGSYLGTLDGARTVQYNFHGAGLKTYYAGSVNYVLYGEMMGLFHQYINSTQAFSEYETRYDVCCAKSLNLIRGLYGLGPFDTAAEEAEAFSDFGYANDGNPPDCAFDLGGQDPQNVASPGVFGWEWADLLQGKGNM
jgi:hypothetical protein